MEILKDQPTEENPYIVDNYPYGFRLRTKIRYWVETTRNGQRFVSQTLNPKTNTWNKPKKSTYDQIILIGLDDNGHITYVSLSASYRSLEECQKFGEKYKNFFTEYQHKEFSGIIGLQKVYSKVEYTISARKYMHKATGQIVESVPLMELNDYLEVTIDENGHVHNEAEQKEINRTINKMAVLSAKKEQSGTINEALETFNRAI